MFILVDELFAIKKTRRQWYDIQKNHASRLPYPIHILASVEPSLLAPENIPLAAASCNGAAVNDNGISRVVLHVCMFYCHCDMGTHGFWTACLLFVLLLVFNWACHNKPLCSVDYVDQAYYSIDSSIDRVNSDQVSQPTREYTILRDKRWNGQDWNPLLF